MKKKTLLFLLGAIISVSMLCSAASAASLDIAVTADNDKLWYWEKGWGWTDTGWIVDANPNVVSHYYDYDNRSGSYRDAYLAFNLSSFSGTADDIISASFNIDVLSVWTDGRDDIGTSSLGTVNYSGGTGWKSFDATQYIKDLVNSNSASANFSIGHTGFSGFTFGSAEGGDPAFLRITTAGNTSNPEAVPEPSTMLLLGGGLVSMVFIRRKK